jgi:hypothetical protein
MVTVWILFLFMGAGRSNYGSAGGPMIIDNIVSESECQRVASLIAKNFKKDRWGLYNKCRFCMH